MDYGGIFLLISLLTILNVVFLYHRLHVKRRKQLGSRHDKTPSLGFAGLLSKHRERLHDYLAECCDLYRTFKVSYPTHRFYYTADPRNVERMLKTNFPNYIKGRLSHENLLELMGDGIFGVDGDAWRQQRKIASFEFSSRSLRDFSHTAFREHGIKLVSFLAHQAKANHPVNWQDAMMRMTLDSICKVGFGVDMGNLSKLEPSRDSLNREFGCAFDRSSGAIFWRYMDPFWKIKRWLGLGVEAQLAKDITTIDTFIYRVLQERKQELIMQRNHTSLNDLLSRFLALSKEDPQNFTNKKIRDIILNFMVAGRDTTSVTLCWFLYMLTKHPDVEAKAVQEVLNLEEEEEEEEGNDDDDDDDDDDLGFPSEARVQKYANLLTYERLNQMNYLHACLAETLRLYPAVPLDSRVAVSDDELPDGTLIQGGDLLGYHAYGMGRMKWIWGEDACEFRPERFLKDGVYQPESPFKHPAFHAGPRMCLGKDFAYLQMKVTAALLLRFLRWELLPSQKVHYNLMITLNVEGFVTHILPRQTSKKSSSTLSL